MLEIEKLDGTLLSPLDRPGRGGTEGGVGGLGRSNTGEFYGARLYTDNVHVVI